MYLCMVLLLRLLPFPFPPISFSPLFPTSPLLYLLSSPPLLSFACPHLVFIWIASQFLLFQLCCWQEEEFFVSDRSSEGTLKKQKYANNQTKTKQRTSFETHRFPALPSLILSMIVVCELHQNLELHLTETFTPAGLTMPASRQNREKEERLDLLLNLFWNP